MYNQYIGTDYVSIEYFLGRSQNHIILILHFIDGIPISPFQCQASLVSGRQRSGCGCPPSFARSQKVGTGILGIKKGPQGPFFIKFKKEIGENGNENK